MTKHLFIDNHEIEDIWNLARKIHQPEKFHANTIIRPEHRWENMYVRMWGGPVWDPSEELFKIIYLGTAAQDISALGTGSAVTLDETGASGTSGNYSCYATSEDGVNWEKPFIGLYEYDGKLWDKSPIGTGNNIIPSINGHIRGPVYHATEPDPNRRFKAQIYRDKALYAAASPDCIHWEELDEIPPHESLDVSELYYDETEDLFISTIKHRTYYGRSFFLSTSKDFENWTEQELIFHADQTDQENGFERLQKFFDDDRYLTPVRNRPEEWRTDIYHFPVFRYEDMYLALPTMHHWAGKHPPLYENVDSRKSVELASSRDLHNWHRVANRAPFMELSPIGEGRYDTGAIGATNGVIRRNDELWFYCMGSKQRSLPIADALNFGYLDSSAISMARLRLDGFVSLKGGIEWGSVTTKPIEVTGAQLHINTDSWRGRVKTEILDSESMDPIPSYTEDDSIATNIDSIDEVARWQDKRDLTGLSGKTVRLRFHLWQAELYSFWTE